MKYSVAKAFCKLAGLAVKDGLAFTVAGGRLTSGQEAPDWIKPMNGWTVEEAGAAIKKQLHQWARDLNKRNNAG